MNAIFIFIRFFSKSFIKDGPKTVHKFCIKTKDHLQLVNYAINDIIVTKMLYYCQVAIAHNSLIVV